MPLYEYECVNCEHKQEQERPVEHRRAMAVCSECGGACDLVIGAVAGFIKGGPTVPSNKRRMKK